MSEFTEKPDLSGKRVSFVMLRRGQKVFLRVPVKSLVAGIRKGKVLPTDEFSPNGEHWMLVGRSRQLAKYFISAQKPLATQSSESLESEKSRDNENKLEENMAPPPHIEKQMSELAEMFREFNG